MVALGDEPSGVNMTDSFNTNLGAESTKSSKGRKLRQVLQKKQLDVLLQTYSSFIDEPEDSQPKTASDFYAITRKQSIEGTGNPVNEIVDLVNHHDGNYSDDGSTVDKDYDNTDIRRMRRNRSLISEDDTHTSTGDRDHAVPVASYEDEAISDHGVAEVKKIKNNIPKETSGRKGKKKHMSKRKKRGDFTTRLLKANDVFAGFGTRCTQKHLEIAVDFHEATKEIRYHLKSGANIVFEDLADHFDGIVENLFVDGNEQRDDDARRQQRSKQQGPVSPRQTRERQPNSERDDPNFQPLSHEETIQTMNKQVSELLKPVTVLAGEVKYMNCIGTPEGSELQQQPRRFPTKASS